MAEMAMVQADDQVSDGTQVTVANVVAAQEGWMVIHADADGRPGPVLGKTAVAAGTTENVIVILDEPVDPDTPLWAMLHVDEGVQGVYEFPGADIPVEEDGAIVMVPFTALGEIEPTEEATTEPTEEATTEPKRLRRSQLKRLRRSRLKKLRRNRRQPMFGRKQHPKRVKKWQKNQPLKAKRVPLRACQIRAQRCLLCRVFSL